MNISGRRKKRKNAAKKNSAAPKLILFCLRGIILYLIERGVRDCNSEVNEGIHLDLDTWIVPGQIRTANLCRGIIIYKQFRSTVVY